MNTRMIVGAAALGVAFFLAGCEMEPEPVEPAPETWEERAPAPDPVTPPREEEPLDAEPFPDQP